MARVRGKWQFIAACTTAVCLGSAAAAYSQFTSFNDRSRALLQGHWQSCREDDGQYAERIYDSKLPGIGPFDCTWVRITSSRSSGAFRTNTAVTTPLKTCSIRTTSR